MAYASSNDQYYLSDVDSPVGLALLRKLDSGAVGPLRAETLLRKHVGARLEAHVTAHRVISELEYMEQRVGAATTRLADGQIDPSLAPAFLSVREELSIGSSEALRRRGILEQASKTLEAIRKRQADQRPPPGYADAVPSPPLPSPPPPVPAAEGAGTSVARLLAELRETEDARRAAVDKYLACEERCAALAAQLEAAQAAQAGCTCTR
ncbi:hypothetical protein Q8F55_008229 [Vanrija albida]|uniref:Uncharacterized protein n=1 Tax=Vanrija albida TaxID=181172 RepID=A0ABR3PVR3_9TREE